MHVFCMLLIIFLLKYSLIGHGGRNLLCQHCRTRRRTVEFKAGLGYERETLSQKNKGWECQSVRLCTAHHKKEIL